VSTVTDVLLASALDEEDAFAAVNEYLEQQEAGRGLLIANGLWSGAILRGKAMQATVGFGAFNCLDWDGFCRAVITAPWREPQNVQLWVKRESDERFLPILDFVDAWEAAWPEPRGRR